ncbi:MAG TPA: AAA family ATPase [Planococcus sp. (in: firmicutes)]|nr:AAA family ATPase [Planococcus sp. (in: firmicutes)]
MRSRIHIMGAAGSGTTTLGAALAKELPHIHLDTDDYFWKTKYTEQRPVPDRIQLLETDLLHNESWILSGSVVSWGEEIKSHFDLVVFVWVPKELRLERLERREYERYGEEMLAGGAKYEQFKAFLEWASLYDHADKEARSKISQEHWMAGLQCPVLRIEGKHSVEERVDLVMKFIQSDAQCNDRMG